MYFVNNFVFVDTRSGATFRDGDGHLVTVCLKSYEFSKIIWIRRMSIVDI